MRYNIVMDDNARYHINLKFYDDPPAFGGVKLIQLGKIYLQNDAVVPAHVHKNWFELTLVTGGEGTVITNGTPTVVKKGDCYLSFPCDIHEIVSSSEHALEYIFVALTITDEQMRARFDKIMSNFYPGSKRIISNPKLITLSENAIYEFSLKDNEYSGEILTHIFGQLVLYTQRDFLVMQENSLPGNVSRAEMFCYRLSSYIDTHIYTLSSLEELAAATNYNYSYISSLFKKTTGGTLADYYRERRLETAKLLLIENKLAIGEIAERLNYSSIYAFSKAFKHRYGASPRAFRPA